MIFSDLFYTPVDMAKQVEQNSARSLRPSLVIERDGNGHGRGRAVYSFPLAQRLPEYRGFGETRDSFYSTTSCPWETDGQAEVDDAGGAAHVGDRPEPSKALAGTETAEAVPDDPGSPQAGCPKGNSTRLLPHYYNPTGEKDGLNYEKALQE